jgi:cyclopropane fatty-acyl-phospholipid synthase-like methyltransferase
VASDMEKKMWEFYETRHQHLFEENRDRAELLAGIILKHTSPGDMIVEAGIGNGQLLMMLSGKRRVAGLDISGENIKRLSGMAEFKGVELKTASLAGMSAHFKGADAVVCSEVIEHLDDAELGEAVREVGKTLKSGGRWFITVPDSEVLSETEIFCPHCGSVFHRYGHKQVFDMARLDSLISGGGFKKAWAGRIHPLKFKLPFGLKIAYRALAKFYLKRSATLVYVAKKG